MHANILGIVISSVFTVLIIGVPVAFAVRLWKYLGRKSH